MNLCKLSRSVSYFLYSNTVSKWYSQTAANLGKVGDLVPPSFTGDTKEYPTHIHEIVNRISTLTLLEVADLSELLQKRLNIKNPSSMMPTMVQAPSNRPYEEPEEQQSPTKMVFSVKLLKFDAAKKIQLIKEIKQVIPEMNLVQAKKFVESAPTNIKVDVGKDEAEQIKKVLEEAGATITIE
ncbi:39S ribosomal protein L12 isoform 2 [Schistosoma japonicum]|uniref:39S ribosomal protein L12 isoform 2 n=2 Tax=Schistosoma japonicum TaxID=6182 RepID=A0A4Z2D1G7_SCHJA|nr:39S ribosomal protein L12, mitochondrial [Schistosoma japonicum]TNN10345.1 39S ribosomal protein L12 isoform 2 [Schistosoma japonicum]